MCNNIMERSKKMLDAAKAMKLSSRDLLELEIIDEIIHEPIGGAHRDKNLISNNIKNSIKKNLDYFRSMSADEIFNERKNKFLKIGRGKGFMSDVEQLSSLVVKENNFKEFFNSKKNQIIFIGLSLAILISLVIFL